MNMGGEAGEGERDEMCTRISFYSKSLDKLLNLMVGSTKRGVRWEKSNKRHINTSMQQSCTIEISRLETI